MKTHANHAQTFRNVPATSKPLSESKVGALLDQEWARYKEATSGSEKENNLATQTFLNVCA